jgi:hypothetical protein
LVVGAALGEDLRAVVLGAGVGATGHHRGVVAAALRSGAVGVMGPVGMHRAGKIRALPGWVTNFSPHGAVQMTVPTGMLVRYPP